VVSLRRPVKTPSFSPPFSRTERYDKDGLGNHGRRNGRPGAPTDPRIRTGARPGQPFPKHLLDAITSVEVVDEL
jgi:hypothetical protein